MFEHHPQENIHYIHPTYTFSKNAFTEVKYTVSQNSIDFHLNFNTACVVRKKRRAWSIIWKRVFFELFSNRDGNLRSPSEEEINTSF